jgi:hypothetical protein
VEANPRLDARKFAEELWQSSLQSSQEGYEVYQRLLSELIRLKSAPTNPSEYNNFRRSAAGPALLLTQLTRTISEYGEALIKEADIDKNPITFLRVLGDLSQALTLMAMTPKAEDLDLAILPNPDRIEEGLNHITSTIPADALS